jgi:pimeloyl-ACP methyl ester carboxylesterase
LENQLKAFPPPGGLIDIGGRRLHANSAGEGPCTVVFESGLAASSLTWCLVQPQVAPFARTIAYDRAGLGWSDPAPHPATAGNAADDLARLLTALGISAPVILVGHSFGGLIARVFEQRYPEHIAGLVLVDPLVRSEWRDVSGPGGQERRRMLERGARLSRRGAVLSRLGVVGLALKLLQRGSRHVPRLVARASAGQGTNVAERLVGEVRKMPPQLWPAIAGHWSRASSFRTMASALENLPVSIGQLDETRKMDALPVSVLSAANAGDQALAEHKADAALSREGRQQLAEGTGHWIPLDAPEMVAQEIYRVVRAAC